ncbi:hypothetical protein ATP_00215 [Candidatus Phytoplasma mali]|uniref:Uncharacterized protein n=1 Tax=Phytoplasma mali (strain AT) TaxID=482235 RepID=B3QZL5_PHYMT|nr:hypothetical protein [Candidatus Phytoplasma mali]CAP18402.1 hypothetical protein ATP_00215 [Candidatus Phytoplasma mali]
MKKPYFKDIDSAIDWYMYFLNEIDLFDEDPQDYCQKYGVINNLLTIFGKLDDFVNHTHGDRFYFEPINCSNAMIADVNAKADKLNTQVREVVDQIDNVITKLDNIAHDIIKLKTEYKIVDGD